MRRQHRGLNLIRKIYGKAAKAFGDFTAIKNTKLLRQHILNLLSLVLRDCKDPKPHYSWRALYKNHSSHH
jgi:hypothetical protein